ncbi:MAG: flagellar type III secretion system pore protein FliP [Armatimonadetes bacterium]|nr:flagellar type III secretion system pore protein FliP [Armatimonadota bacterium]
MAAGILVAPAGAAPAGRAAAGAVPGIPVPGVDLRISPATGPQQVSTSLQILMVLTLLALAPALLIMLTSFTRIVIVLSLVRSAIGVPTIPPNQVVIGMALFLTFFTMAPVITVVNRNAVEPYMRGEIAQADAIRRAEGPIRAFMLRQTRERDLALFVSLAKEARPAKPDDIPTYVIVPAFAVSELRTAFLMGSLIFIPFLIIDMVISSTLMSMGMMMLSPVLISLPFKLLLFAMVDGWHLVVRALVQSFI